ncbi:MAG: hypothetical protein JSU01_13600 [Bacteroidetes bacterium]|nr:hypothetical protein [Bacteroidota bacterium]
MTEYLDDTDGRWDDDQLGGKPNAGNSSDKQKKDDLETKGPARNKAGKVLHEDGSFAELPDKEGEGSGALDGTVGRGM